MLYAFSMLNQSKRSPFLCNIQNFSVHSTVEHDLSPLGLVYFGTALDDAQFMHFHHM